MDSTIYLRAFITIFTGDIVMMGKLNFNFSRILRATANSSSENEFEILRFSRPSIASIWNIWAPSQPSFLTPLCIYCCGYARLVFCRNFRISKTWSPFLFDLFAGNDCPSSEPKQKRPSILHFIPLYPNETSQTWEVCVRIRNRPFLPAECRPLKRRIRAFIICSEIIFVLL